MTGMIIALCEGWVERRRKRLYQSERGAANRGAGTVHTETAPLGNLCNDEVGRMSDKQTRWMARLTPMLHGSVDALLNMPLGLDVWERHTDALVVAASDAQLSEIERRHIAQVERLSTVAEFQARAQQRGNSSEKRNQQ
jgi:hypothetical protein